MSISRYLSRERYATSARIVSSRCDIARSRNRESTFDVAFRLLALPRQTSNDVLARRIRLRAHARSFVSVARARARRLLQTDCDSARRLRRRGRGRLGASPPPSGLPSSSSPKYDLGFYTSSINYLYLIVVVDVIFLYRYLGDINL